LPLFVSVSGAALTTTILKIVINRGRPPSVDMMYLENQPSFPSGHATAAMALYGFLIYAVYKLDKGFVKNFFIAFLSILIVLVGISRLYLGVHYLSDVIMGYMVGLVWILIAAKLDKKIEKILNWKPGGLNNHR
jgi:undecaprenyl-diphosphatase